MNTYRVLIRIIWKSYHTIGFTIPSWDGGKTIFRAKISSQLFKKISPTDRIFVKTQLGEDNSENMTFDEWEYPKQMTDKELDEFFHDLLGKNKEKDE